MTRGRGGASRAAGGSGGVDLPGPMPHANDGGSGEVAAVAAVDACPGSGVALGLVRAPLVRTRTAAPSNATSTVPSVSVRYVRRACSPSRQMVEGAGWP
jgi:hypothetical protein